MRKQVHINSLHPLMKLYLKHIPEDGILTYLKLDSLEIMEDDAQRMWEEGNRYIWAYRTLYRLTCKPGLKLDLVREHRNPKDSLPVTKRGRYISMDPNTARSYRVD